MISSNKIQQKNDNKKKEIINRNFEASYYSEKIIIDVDKSESSALYLILIFFFSLDTLDLLIAIQLDLLYLGIISIILDIIILVFLYSGYSNYKDLNVHWIFNKRDNLVEIYRKSSQINEQDILKFQDIEAFTLSENIYIHDRFYVSCVTKNHEKLKICYGDQKECYILAKKFSDFLDIPLIQRNFFEKSLLISSSFLIFCVILLFVLFFLISIQLIFEYIIFILLKTGIILSILRVIFLLKEHIKAENYYFKMLRKLTKKS